MPDFTKYQALGNDYLVVDPMDVAFAPGPDAAVLLCDRHFGVGADGVLFGPIGPVEPGRPVRLQIFNSDGTECERSGNGIRMFALHLAEHHAVTEREFTVRTFAGDAPVRVIDPAAGTVSVGMGRPDLDAAAVPMTGVRGPAVDQPLSVGGTDVMITALRLGNPHAVVRTDVPSRAMAAELGPLIAGHDRFPTRTNVEFLRVVDRRTIEIEVWERAAGYTLASGAGACAAACVAYRLGLVDPSVTVRMPGGELLVEFDNTGAVTMTGDVAKVLTGYLAPALVARLAGLAPTEAFAGAAS